MADRKLDPEALADIARHAQGWQLGEDEELRLLTVRRTRGEVAHLIARPESAERLRDLLEQDVPSLLAEVKRLRGEVHALTAELARRPEKAAAAEEPAAKGGPSREAAEEAGAELALLLSAPFRPTGEDVSAAKDDPLRALAVQVARAAAPDASELDRARLLAMAFAANRGDLDAFWTARRQRKVKG